MIELKSSKGGDQKIKAISKKSFLNKQKNEKFFFPDQDLRHDLKQSEVFYSSHIWWDNLFLACIFSQQNKRLSTKGENINISSIQNHLNKHSSGKEDQWW